MRIIINKNNSSHQEDEENVVTDCIRRSYSEQGRIYS